MSAMEPAYVALIVIAWVLLDATMVVGLVLLRLRGERRVRHAGEQLAAEAERYVDAVRAERAAAVPPASLHRARERNLSAQRR
jgi:cytochrome c-type biogenesis protein CcmH/NrfF